MTFLSWLFPKLPEGATGLMNLGNTCYLNSVLQCLSHTEYLTEFALQYKLPYYIKGDQQRHYTESVAESMIQVIQQIYSAQSTISPKEFLITFRAYNKSFCNGEQKDAAEFLMLLITKVDSDLRNQTYSVPPPSVISADYVQSFVDYSLKNRSIITQIMGGMIHTHLECSFCKASNDFSEPFTIIQLPIQIMFSTNNCKMPYITLYDCLESFMQSSHVCSVCFKLQTPYRTFVATPPILVFQLLRFKQTEKGSEKDTTRVFYPLRDLVVSGVKYELYSQIIHYGKINSGHYTANCVINGEWFAFNDGSVDKIENANVMNSSAYLLFYKRTETPK
ncbi:hypothetical protein EIN_250370 [Entamoeba invadens IP1]|uniref:USP domain-containing protein n=1 Tax=Entamoeba invadens IP1 TaxID=370355 RepID=A0A0A1UEM5_ENTIV|nr:hypothetical protein EIN_250370 [Entamoeba invadens IP1]ELP94943.1 hypothetical protein EIN_250370 [Entamoeba invadens IP1]|eukprot:XP_004261714.1 hypothetical protein EIN_250370 [Entamoeba invadens IP1]